MAVPILGAISMRGIRRELGTNNYNSSTNYTNISLQTMSTGGNGTINTANSASVRPDGSAPHEVSEFAGYDHDKTSNTTPPTVSTTSASHDSTNNEMDMGGYIAAQGSSSITARGFVYSASTTSPTLTSSGTSTETVPGTSTGLYSGSVPTSTMLVGPNGTTYNVRAYATNGAGTGYGSTRSVFIPSSGGGFGGGGGGFGGGGGGGFP